MVAHRSGLSLFLDQLKSFARKRSVDALLLQNSNVNHHLDSVKSDLMLFEAAGYSKTFAFLRQRQHFVAIGFQNLRLFA
jgi:hypothetical protein